MPTKVSQSLDLDARVWAAAQRLKQPSDRDVAATIQRILRTALLEEAARLGLFAETASELFSAPGESLLELSKRPMVSITRFSGGIPPATEVEEMPARTTVAKKKKQSAATPKMGRPAKPADAKRMPFTIQLDPEARRILDAAAARAAMSRSEVLNRLLRFADQARLFGKITVEG